MPGGCDSFGIAQSGAPLGLVQCVVVVFAGHTQAVWEAQRSTERKRFPSRDLINSSRQLIQAKNKSSDRKPIGPLPAWCQVLPCQMLGHSLPQPVIPTESPVFQPIPIMPFSSSRSLPYPP